MTDDKTKALGRARQAEYKAARLAEGYRRMPAALLSPDAGAALDALRDAGYGRSAQAVIERALIDAAKNL